MPWVCEVCSLKNVDDHSKRCDLCNALKGTPDPAAGKDAETRLKSKRLSLTAILRAGPEEFDREIQEKRRLDELKVTKGVFGVELRTPAPRLICDCISFIEGNGLTTEGIFRIPGQQDTVDALRAAYEKDENRNVLAEIKCENHDVATLFKTYFRMLPTPLLPTTHYDLLMEAVRIEHKTKEELMQAVMDVCIDVRSPERELLGFIIHFLKKVASHQDVNKMTPANLATCFAPSLFRAPEGASAQQALMDMSAAIGALNILIRSPFELPIPEPEEIRKNTKYKVKAPPPPKPVAPPPGMAAGLAKPPGFD